MEINHNVVDFAVEIEKMLKQLVLENLETRDLDVFELYNAQDHLTSAIFNREKKDGKA